jgi:23S rRNA pseudouridine2605 synthase
MAEKNRLSKLLAAAGVASRRACEELIFAGHVRVNGQVVLQPQTLVSYDEDRIALFGETIVAAEQKVHYVLHKPAGYTCSSVRTGSKKIVLDLFGSSLRLFTVGRLDRDTSGLLLVTNDGPFAQRVIHPSAGLVKEYLVKTEQEITHEHLLSLSEGMRLEGSWVQPARVLKVRRGTLKISVREGKKREVRLLAAKAGLTVLSLQRIRIGGLTLGALPPGAYREMTAADHRALFS